MKKNVLLYVTSDAAFFISHRLALAQAARAIGYEVHIACPYDVHVERIIVAGFKVHPISLQRRSLNPWQEIKTFIALYKLYKSLQPMIIHHLTIKPIVYGGIAARIANVSAVINAPTGLGYVFTTMDFRGVILRQLLKTPYRIALGHPNSRTIFQNPDDRFLFIKNRLVKEKKTALIKGSGVDINYFLPLPEPEGIPVVALIARMLWDKGVNEFVQATQLLQQEKVIARFVLVGDTDPGNPAAVPRETLQKWAEAGRVEWWGWQNNMLDVFAKSHIVCLPSYREGIPKVLLEAASCGRPIVTTDVPGCKEVVVNNVNGFVVEVKNAEALAGAIKKLVSDATLRQRMGNQGRELVKSEFSIEKVIAATLAVYREIVQLP